METQRIYKDFDLPTKHLTGNQHYVPPKARDEAEIDRRHQLARGTLILEEQQLGLGIAATILKLVREPGDVAFASQLIAASGLNTAWYAFARGAEPEVMRRRLKLPDLTARAPEYRPTSSELLDEAAWLFGEAMQFAGQATDALQYNPQRHERLRKTVGRVAGRASLFLASAHIGDQLIEVGGLSSVDTQNLVRQHSLQALDAARTLESALGVPPSIAQLANPYSNLSVHWHNHAPNGALQAFEQALDYRLAA